MMDRTAKLTQVSCSLTSRLADSYSKMVSEVAATSFLSGTRFGSVQRNAIAPQRRSATPTSAESGAVPPFTARHPRCGSTRSRARCLNPTTCSSTRRVYLFFFACAALFLSAGAFFGASAVLRFEHAPQQRPVRRGEKAGQNYDDSAETSPGKPTR